MAGPFIAEVDAVFANDGKAWFVCYVKTLIFDVSGWNLFLLWSGGKGLPVAHMTVSTLRSMPSAPTTPSSVRRVTEVKCTSTLSFCTASI